VPFLCLAVLITSGSSTGQEGQTDRKVESLRAFAKLYGYVRFFHPSDEAASVDWDRFAIYGAERAESARSREELRATLEELFLPIAPTVQLYRTGERPEPAPLLPDDTTGLEVVAWQHRGVSLAFPLVHRSKRLNRELEVVAGGYGMLTQSIDATVHRGKRIRYRAYVRAEVTVPYRVQLRLRVHRPGNRMGFFDNMRERVITSGDWQLYEIEGPVADDATRIVFGCSLLGQGRVWVDAVEVAVQGHGGEWEPIEIANPGFEEADEGGRPAGWWIDNPGFRYSVTSENAHSGDRSLLIEDGRVVLTEPLFDAHPKVGEVIEKEIGAGLSCRVPLSLYSEDGRTLGPEPPHSLTALLAQLDDVKIGELTADDESVRIADVIIAWNVFQHFYPYFDVVDVDWDAQLTSSLEAAWAETSGEQFYYTLSELVASIRDGHGNVYHQSYTPQGRLPLLLAWIEGRVVVTRSLHEGIERGDIVEMIDGIEAERAVLDAERYISGSPQWKRFRVWRFFGAGEVGTMAGLVVQRGDKRLELQVERRELDAKIHEFEREAIQILQDGVYYVDLDRAGDAAISERITELAAARGVIFDLRGYPMAAYRLISHLLSEPVTPTAWDRVPQIIYPDLEKVAWSAAGGWQMPALEPHIGGKVVFITDGRAISNAESFLSFIEAYQLAEIVGQPTAGTTGTANTLALPGGFRVTWTGHKMVKHDGSQFHLIGIQPTVPVERTLQGVIEGRDALLERALDIINQS
jgi:hypothetical protein